MKKIITVMIAALVMAFSTVPAFAASIESPVATTAPETQPNTRVSVPDNGNTSPKTGENAGVSDVLVYTMIGLAIAGCTAASVALVKSANKK